jgi:hypothetical protein
MTRVLSCNERRPTFGQPQDPSLRQTQESKFLISALNVDGPSKLLISSVGGVQIQDYELTINFSHYFNKRAC